MSVSLGTSHTPPPSIVIGMSEILTLFVHCNCIALFFSTRLHTGSWDGNSVLFNEWKILNIFIKGNMISTTHPQPTYHYVKRRRRAAAAEEEDNKFTCQYKLHGKREFRRFSSSFLCCSLGSSQRQRRLHDVFLLVGRFLPVNSISSIYT